MRKFLLKLVAVVFVLSSFMGFGELNLVQAVDLTDPSTVWTEIIAGNNQNDYVYDQQTGSTPVSQDIVGDATHPATYIRFADGEVAFRMRLGDADGTSNDEFKNFAFVGIDLDLDGSVDFFLGAYNPTGNNGRLGIYTSDGSLNISPSTTGISGAPLLAFAPEEGDNFYLEPAGTSIGGGTDYFLSFKFSIDDISTALQGTGYSFTSTSVFAFMVGTAAQDNSFNQDLNGMGADGWSSGDTWSDLGVFTDPVRADGTTINYTTVIFDNNDGNTEADFNSRSVETGTALGELPSVLPTKSGMTFVEWNTKADGTGSTVTVDTIVDSSLSDTDNP